jgi:proliferating cell nuclear antigen
MKFSFDRISRFVAPLHALRDLNDAIHIVFGKASCRAIVMDVSHVSISFVSWECHGVEGEDVVVALKLTNILTALGLARDSGDSFSLELESPDSDTITLIMDDGDTTVQLRLLDSESESMSPPAFEDATSCIFDTTRFREVCKELSLIGDTVSFSCDGKVLILNTSGDAANAKITLRPITVVNPAQVPSLSISLRYLNSILKGYTVSSRVKISFMESMPVCMVLDSNDVSMETYIAPKMEMDEE